MRREDLYLKYLRRTVLDYLVSFFKRGIKSNKVY